MLWQLQRVSLQWCWQQTKCAAEQPPSTPPAQIARTADNVNNIIEIGSDSDSDDDAFGSFPTLSAEQSLLTPPPRSSAPTNEGFIMIDSDPGEDQDEDDYGSFPPESQSGSILDDTAVETAKDGGVADESSTDYGSFPASPDLPALAWKPTWALCSARSRNFSHIADDFRCFGSCLGICFSWWGITMDIDCRLVIPYLWSSYVLWFQDGARITKLCSIHLTVRILNSFLVPRVIMSHVLILHLPTENKVGWRERDAVKTSKCSLWLTNTLCLKLNELRVFATILAKQTPCTYKSYLSHVSGIKPLPSSAPIQ